MWPSKMKLVSSDLNDIYSKESTNDSYEYNPLNEDHPRGKWRKEHQSAG